jgi:hypothetical protein
VSHTALARVVLRMHFDPAFVAAVHRDPEAALEPEGLTAEEREDLLAVDPRAFGVDLLRPARARKDLCDEYRVSSTLVLAATRRLADLDAFFSGPHFHDEVQGRGSLARAFAAHLRGFAGRPGLPPQFPDVLRLEETTARLRREIETPPAPPPPGTCRRAPAVAGLRVGGSTLEVVNAVERWLFEASLLPAPALCDDAPGLPPLPPARPGEPRHLLLSPDGEGGIALAEPGKAAVEALISLEEPLPEEDFAARAASRGLRPDLARRLLADLVDAALVVRG